MSETTTEAPTEQEQKPAAEAKSFTQDEVNALLAKQKREQFGDYGDLKKAAAQLEEIKQSQQTAEEKAAGALKAAEDRAETAESSLIRLQVAFDKGLTPAQAKRLVGSNREELEADADELLETFKAPEPEKPTVDLDLGTRPTGAVTTDPRSADLAQIEADLKAAKRR